MNLSQSKSRPSCSKKPGSSWSTRDSGASTGPTRASRRGICQPEKSLENQNGQFVEILKRPAGQEKGREQSATPCTPFRIVKHTVNHSGREERKTQFNGTYISGFLFMTIIIINSGNAQHCFPTNSHHREDYATDVEDPQATTPCSRTSSRR